MARSAAMMDGGDCALVICREWHRKVTSQWRWLKGNPVSEI